MTGTTKRRVGLALATAWSVLLPGSAAAQRPPSLERLVPVILWSEDEATRQRAESAIEAEASFMDLSRIRFHDLEEIIRRGRTQFPPPPQWAYGRFLPEEITVTLPGGETMPATVELPPCYEYGGKQQPMQAGSSFLRR
jgi:hypothetical protein